MSRAPFASGEPSPRLLLWLLAGFGIWGNALVALYALHALGCAFAWPPAALRLALLATLLAHLAALAAALALARRARWPGSEEGRALSRYALWTLWAALVATLVSLGPPIALSVCLP